MDEYMSENAELLSYFIKENFDRIALIIKPGDENNLNLLIKYLGGKYPAATKPGIIIRVKDLKIFPSKDLQLDLFCAGQFIVKNNQIIGIIPHNVIMLIVLNEVRRDQYPLCCYCNKCNGDNWLDMYNASGEIFMPRPEFCSQYQGEQNIKISDCYD